MTGLKTEQPTPKRKKKARLEGQVAKSADLKGAFVLFVVLIALVSLAPMIFLEITEFMRHSIDTSFSSIQNPTEFLLEGVLVLARILAPIIGVGFFASLVISYLQVGPGFSIKSLTPDMNRLNMGSGFKRLFSSDRFVDLLKVLIKLFFVGAISIFVYWNTLKYIARVSESSIVNALEHFGQSFTFMTYAISGALFVVGIGDYLWQRHSTNQKTMMSKQELKDELKASEGDPIVRSKRNLLRRQFLREAGLSNLHTSVVIVVDRNHVSAAIAYNETMVAPRLVTSGFDEMAKRIRREAVLLGIPIISNAYLAKALSASDIDEAIPETLYDELIFVLRQIDT